ncbi:MAG TPA: YbjN domain-containing protein [Gemmatimonadaceae bacterium]|nr:YbjN domain-containing protein [Gemmatimonadaceae bacterium]
MSVLIESRSLVTQRATLDGAWPGGTADFLVTMCEPGSPARDICFDDRLFCVSFRTAEDAMSVIRTLRDAGLVELDERKFHDIALVEPSGGPTRPCAWLEWKRHADGFTYAWLSGTEPGEMAAPAGWKPESRDEPGRRLRLAREGNVETWLDFETGEVMSETKSSAGLLDTVKSALDEREFRWQPFEDDGLSGRLSTRKATYELFVHADEARRTLGFYLLFPTHAPGQRRAAVAELCARANWHILLGSLEMEFADGNVRWRAALDVEDGALSETMVHNYVTAGAWTLDRYHDALVQVMIGGAEPAVAFADVDE